MINKVILIGNLGSDPEIRNLENGSKVAKFSIATNENYQDKSGEWQKITEWHNIVAWRALADRAENYLKKGSMVYLEGKLTTRKWQDQNGNDKYTTEIVARLLRSLEKRESSGTSGYTKNFPTATDEFPAPKKLEGEMSKTPPVASSVQEDDDLPF